MGILKNLIMYCIANAATNIISIATVLEWTVLTRDKWCWWWHWWWLWWHQWWHWTEAEQESGTPLWPQISMYSSLDSYLAGEEVGSEEFKLYRWFIDIKRLKYISMKVKFQTSATPLVSVSTSSGPKLARISSLGLGLRTAKELDPLTVSVANVKGGSSSKVVFSRFAAVP